MAEGTWGAAGAVVGAGLAWAGFGPWWMLAGAPFGGVVGLGLRLLWGVATTPRAF